MASKGSASWMLPYPRHEDGVYRAYESWSAHRYGAAGELGPWARFLQFCHILKRTGTIYDIQYVHHDTHAQAFVCWQVPR